jgi:hypothetical protein
MEGEKKRGWWALAGIAVLTLLGLYVGAYLAMVDPLRDSIDGRRFGWKGNVVFQDYRWIGAERGAWLFWPIHMLDKHAIRRAVWDESVPP